MLCGMGPVLYAHSANVHGERQLLVEHLRNVASLSQEFARLFGGGEVAFLAGLWHDVGKADPRWQRHLLECEAGTRERIGLDHKCAGVLLEEGAAGQPGLVSLLIHAHHGGLKDRFRDFQPWLSEKRKLDGPSRAIAALREVMPDLTGHSAPTLPPFVAAERDAEFFLRMTYSALVDADSLDTEAHKLGGAPPERGKGFTLPNLWERYEAFLNRQPPGADSPVNRVRRDVHRSCVEAASSPPGMFRLTVPTGGGKTRSAMAFALRHGIEHGLRRVVVAVPFTTITQQTAGVYRDVFGDDRVVLEHHSAGAETADMGSDDESYSEAAVWQRLASENWDAPIVVTTTVQLFESLFSNRRGKTRKLHNLAGSVVILDEAQALPPGLLSPILDGLRRLIENYGASVVLSTATQPAFDLIKELREVDACELVPDHARHFEALERVKYTWKADVPRQWNEVAGWMREERSALAIVNTKRHAMELLDALGDGDALHLSTLLCGAHRSQVIEEIRRRLREGEPCLVVSTQVVEAGVDLDFETVFRAEAPLDAVIQAAGRCNREGKLDGQGQVVVFASPDGRVPPGAYETGRDTAREVRALFPDAPPDDLRVLRAYFERMAERIPADAHGVQEARTALDFPLVAERFRMIDEDTCDVIVDWPEGQSAAIERLVDQLRDRQGSPRTALRRLQPYTVSLRRREYERLTTEGYVTELPGFRELGRWQGRYDSVRGIVEANPELIA
ncbi:MAG: CRISPR-associated helicase Cas3' [Gammaproteobacteria bacterium]|nr:CRISPR-associated helicase Cas3' [Gammaproteobacteria bacterium]